MNKKRFLIVGEIVIVATCIAVLVISQLNSPQKTAVTTASSQSTEKFPDINTDNLTNTQKIIIDTARTEYREQPAGIKYSEGVTEPWCADFVSWVYREAGIPFTNPNSGSWRIPGTVTLREYYQSIGKFRSPDSGYMPKSGDTMIYDNSSQFGQHVNIVLSVDGDSVTTIGGNENGKIRVLTHREHYMKGFIGYGVL